MFIKESFHAQDVLLALGEYLKPWILQSKCQKKSACIDSGENGKTQMINACIFVVRFNDLYLGGKGKVQFRCKKKQNPKMH